MSYHRPLSGVSSRVYGTTVAPRALSGVSSRVYGTTVAPRYVGLGDEEPMTEADWRKEMLTAQRAVAAKAAEWVKQDEKIRYMQIAATVMIPVSAAIWKWILGRRRGSGSSDLSV